jgi:hypothetical protein
MWKCTVVRIIASVSVAALGITVGVAVLSSVATMTSGESDWAVSDLRLRVVDANGSPIEGAKLTLFRGGAPASDFQKAYCSTPELVSAKDGRINFLIKPFRYRIRTYRLFWIVPITRPDVEFTARIDAAGYRPTKVPLVSFFDSSNSKGSRPMDETDAANGYGFANECEIFAADVVLEL